MAGDALFMGSTLILTGALIILTLFLLNLLANQSFKLYTNCAYLFGTGWRCRPSFVMATTLKCLIPLSSPSWFAQCDGSAPRIGPDDCGMEYLNFLCLSEPVYHNYPEQLENHRETSGIQQRRVDEIHRHPQSLAVDLCVLLPVVLFHRDQVVTSPSRSHHRPRFIGAKQGEAAESRPARRQFI